MRIGLLAFILALVIGYGQSWSAYYIKWLVGRSSVNVLGSLNQFRILCDEPATAKAVCTHAYVIRSSFYKEWGEDAAIGVGQILSATRFRCLEAGPNSVAFDDPTNPGRTFETFTTYQTVQLSSLHCRDGIKIEAWSRPSAVRKGYIGGTVTVGHYTAIDRVKKLTEFFMQQLLFGLAVVFSILAILSDRLHRYSDGKGRRHDFEVALPVWFLNSLVVSNIAQTFFAFIQVPQVFNRASMFLTHFGMLLIPLLQLSRRYKFVKHHLVLIESVAGIIFFAFASSPFFAQLYLPTHAAILVCMTTSAFLTQEYEHLFLVSIIASGCLKILGVSSMPAEYATYPFFAFAVSFTLLSKIRLNARIAYLAKWAQSSDWRKSSSNLLETVFEKMHKEIGAGRTTLLSVSPEGQVKVQMKRGSEKVQTLILAELPPLFAHVFSIREPMLHLDANSERYKQISRGAKPKANYSTQLFSIIPIESESRTIGAVAFTDYPESWATSDDQTFLMTYLTGTFESTLVEQIQANDWRKRGQWSETLLKVQKEIPNAKSLVEAHHIICSALKCFGFLASLDQKSRLFSVHAIEGYVTEVDERLRNGRLYALRENQQGPLAIAANQEKSVIIPDVKLIWSVLHANSRLFFEKCGTKSCASIPVFSKNKSGERSLWGVLFLERAIDEPFSLEGRTTLEQIATEVTEILGRFEQEKVASEAMKALSSFVPPRILDQVIQNELQREDDTGLFIMLDLKDSTKLATAVGAETWLKNARALSGPLETIAKRYGLTWHYFNWDAFYFTRTTASPHTDDLQNIISFYEDAIRQVREYYRENYSAHGSYDAPDSKVARMCITHGDVSRGFHEGATRVWTIVGTEMAAMSKLEDMCKKLDGSLFCDESVGGAVDGKWIDTLQTVPSTGRRIYKCILDSAEKRHRDLVDAA